MSEELLLITRQIIVINAPFVFVQLPGQFTKTIIDTHHNRPVKIMVLHTLFKIGAFSMLFIVEKGSEIINGSQGKGKLFQFLAHRQ